MLSRAHHKLLASLVISAPSFPLFLKAQTTISGDITGTVTEATHAVVPDGKVALVSKDTGWRLALFRNPREERDATLLKIESASSLLFLWFLLRIGCKNFIDGIGFLVSLHGGCWLRWAIRV
jgi:hypothetical protein